MHKCYSCKTELNNPSLSLCSACEKRLGTFLKVVKFIFGTRVHDYLKNKVEENKNRVSQK